MSRFESKFNLRMPDDLKERVTERSKQNGRSINSEIVAAIEQALSSVSSGPNNKIAEEVSEILERVKDIEKQIKG